MRVITFGLFLLTGLGLGSCLDSKRLPDAGHDDAGGGGGTGGTGERPIAALQVGDWVYSVHEGAVRLVPIARIHRVPVVNHHVMHVVLSTGATLDISPSHPLTDGRTLGDLRAGDVLDHASVICAELVAYAHDFTYDILPASDTGYYVASGVLIASTLR